MTERLAVVFTTVKADLGIIAGCCAAGVTASKNCIAHSAKLLVTSYAIYSLVKATVVYTIGSNNVLLKNLACNIAVATYGAGIGGVAAVYTIGIGHYCIVAMTKCLGLVSNVAVAAYGAGVGGVAAVYTVGIGHYGFVVVTECRNALLRKKHVSTYGALLTIGQASLCAGGCLTGNNFFIVIGAKISLAHVANVILGIKIYVTVCRNHVLRKKGVATYGALATVGQASLGTSRSLTAYGLGGVTKSRNAIISVAVITYGTGVGGIALVLTVRNSHFRGVAVTERCNVLGIGVRSIVLAGVGLKTVSYAGRSESLYAYVIMSKRGRRLSGVSIAASGAGVCGKACALASRCGYYRAVAMTECRNLISNVVVAANGASVGGVAAGETVGRSNFRVILMSVGRYYALLYCGNAAGGTLLTLGKTGSGTSGRYCGNNILSMSLSRNLISNVAVSAHGTGIGGIAYLGAGGLGK